jgi:hypothetical protein
MERTIGLLDYRTDSDALSWAYVRNSAKGVRLRKRHRLKKWDIVARGNKVSRGNTTLWHEY